MELNFKLLIKEAIDLETNIAQLYLLFHRLFPEDEKLWWELSLEEQNHASLLKTALQFNDSNVDVPETLLPVGAEELKKSSLRIVEFIKSVESNADRTRAFQFAYMIENSAGELHYDLFMKGPADTTMSALFKKLNGDDINHADRIRSYMIKHKIPMAEEN
jgi:hypothetical protein